MAEADPDAPMLGAKIREIRTALEMPQNEMARSIGIDVGTLSRWELGRQPPPPWAPAALTGVAARILIGGNRPKRYRTGSYVQYLRTIIADIGGG